MNKRKIIKYIIIFLAIIMIEDIFMDHAGFSSYESVK